MTNEYSYERCETHDKRIEKIEDCIYGKNSDKGMKIILANISDWVTLKKEKEKAFSIQLVINTIVVLLAFALNIIAMILVK